MPRTPHKTVRYARRTGVVIGIAALASVASATSASATPGGNTSNDPGLGISKGKTADKGQGIGGGCGGGSKNREGCGPAVTPPVTVTEPVPVVTVTEPVPVVTVTEPVPPVTVTEPVPVVTVTTPAVTVTTTSVVSVSGAAAELDEPVVPTQNDPAPQAIVADIPATASALDAFPTGPAPATTVPVPVEVALALPITPQPDQDATGGASDASNNRAAAVVVRRSSVVTPTSVELASTQLDAAPTELPRTGVDFETGVALGLILLLTGGAFVVMGRKEQDSPSAPAIGC